MAAGDNETRMRLLEFADIGGGILGELPLNILAARPQLLDLYIVGKPADAAGFSEIDPPTARLGGSTGVAVETISSSGDDGNAAADHLQGISAIGISGADKLVTVQMLATSAAWTTFQLHTETWKEIFHPYGSLWGTGDLDPSGDVDF